MITYEELASIYEKYGADYFLRQLAEECSELTQAALKIVRVQNGETPVSIEDAREAFLEEFADVIFMLWCIQELILSESESQEIDRIMERKSERMKRRMLPKCSETP